MHLVHIARSCETPCQADPIRAAFITFKYRDSRAVLFTTLTLYRVMNVRHEVERLFEIMRASVVMNSLTVKVVPKGRLVEAS